MVEPLAPLLKPLDPSLTTFVHPTLPEPEVVPEASALSDVITAAKEQENDVWNFYEMMSRERFPPQEGWDEVAYLKKKGLLEQGDALIGTSSQAEMNWKIVKVAMEQENRHILEAAGWPGFVAQVAMGALSPTMAIPFLRASTGARSIALGAASVLGGAAVQEAVLMANQETRTGSEVAFSLAASTVLGGVLGGIFHTLSKGVVDKIVRDMDAGMVPEAVSKPVPFTNESAVGADVIDQVEDVGKLKEGWGAGQLSRAKITQNPIIRGLQQWDAPAILKEVGGSSELRRLTSGFSQDSLTLTGNTDWRAASPGGNVEDLKRTYATISYDAHKAIEGAYIDYMKTNSGVFKLSRAQVTALGDSTKMNYPEFKRQIALDIWTNFTRDNVAPEVRKAAQTLDKAVYKKLYDEGVKAGIFTGEEKVVGDQNYANRMYKHKTIMARHEEFVKILADNYRGNLEKEFTEASAKVRERMMKDRQQLADMQRSTAEIENLKRDLEEEAAAIEETTPLEVTAGAATIKDLRQEMVEIKRELETLNKSRSADPAAAVARQSRVGELEAQLRQKALEESVTKEALGEDLGKYTKAVQEIRRRLHNLARANAVVDVKRQKVLTKIEQNEDAQIGTILRARQQLDKFVKFLAKGSDAEIERELSKLKNSFEGYAEKFEKLENKLVEIEEQGYSTAGKAEFSAEQQRTFSGTLDLAHGFNDRPKVPTRELTADEKQLLLEYANERQEQFDKKLFTTFEEADAADAINMFHITGLMQPDKNFRKEFRKGTTTDDAGRYGNSVFGDDDTVYFDGDGKWLAGEVDRMLFVEAISAKVKFEKALVINPKTFEDILEKVKASEGNATGADIATWAKKTGHDGLIIDGMDDWSAKNDMEAINEKLGHDYAIFQDQVVSFNPDNIKLGEEAPVGKKAIRGQVTKQLKERSTFLPEEAIAVKQDEIAVKMNEFAERIDDLDSFDRVGWRAEVDQMMRDLADTATKVNARRVLRNEKLWKRAERLSPEAQAKRVAKVEEKAKGRLPKFNESWRAQGAVDADIMTGKADFTDAADEIAREVTKKILGVDRRLAYSDIIRELRGPELARVLNIPSEKIIDFLEDDVEKMIAVYTRTLGADLSIMQVFKSLDMAEPLSKLDDERQAVLKRLSSATKKDGTPKYTQEQLEKESLKVNQFYDQGRKDVLVLYERARGMRGIPQDADAWSYRAAKIAMDLNYLRFMGSVVISSIPDIARIVMRHGLERTMRSAVIPMITNFKTIRISQREAMRAGTALDQVMHTRMYSISDVFDDANRGTAIERGIHLMATRLGTFGLFDQWNSAIKQITAGVVNTRLLDSIAMVMGDVKASAKEMTQATEFLARNNITEDIAQTIWKEVTNGKGGGKVNGIWLPNTEDWNIADPAVAFARRAYRAALGGEVDATIITPGFGRPNWTDANTLGRMLAQFKSFGLVSTQKTLMAGLQEHDAAFFNGVMLSLGLGMVSYFLWAKSVGGKAEEEMYQAIEDGNWEKFADEAIARSGVLGVFSEVQRVAERIPLLRKYANLSGSPSTRREGGDLTEALLGPSFDLLEKSGNFIAGVDEPAKSTIHQLRLMLPFQNLFYFRRILDAVEDAAPLPERRKKEK